MREKSPMTKAVFELLADGKAYTRKEIVRALSEKMEMDNKKKNSLGTFLHYQVSRNMIVKEGAGYRIADPLVVVETDLPENVTAEAEEVVMQAEEALEAVAESEEPKAVEEAAPAAPRRRGRPRKSDEEKAAAKAAKATGKGAKKAAKADEEGKSAGRRSARNAERTARNKAREERKAAREAEKARKDQRTHEVLVVAADVPATKSNPILDLEACLKHMFVEAEKAAQIVRSEISFTDLNDTALRNVLVTYEKIVRAKKELE